VTGALAGNHGLRLYAGSARLGRRQVAVCTDDCVVMEGAMYFS
jgi:hypothetical protein